MSFWVDVWLALSVSCRLYIPGLNERSEEISAAEPKYLKIILVITIRLMLIIVCKVIKYFTSATIRNFYFRVATSRWITV